MVLHLLLMVCVMISHFLTHRREIVLSEPVGEKKSEN